MHKYRLLISTFTTSTALLLSGCASGLGPVISKNGITGSVPAPRIETINKKASITVGEAVTGYGCRESSFGIFKSGERHFLVNGDTLPSNDLEYAKAAAAYDALFGRMKDHPQVYHEKQKPFPNDILVAPTYHYEETGSWVSKQTCATVTGFRGSINKLEDSESTTEWPAPTLKIIKKIQ